MKDKRVLAGVAVLFLVAFWFYIKPNYLDAKPPPPPPTEEQIAAAKRPTVFLGKSNAAAGHGAAAPPVEALVLNLKAPGAAPAYAKVIMALEFADPKRKYVGVPEASLAAKNEAFAHALGPEMHKILDAVTTVFGSKTADETASPEGRAHLKDELVKAINEHLHGEQVTTIYFQTFITQ